MGLLEAVKVKVSQALKDSMTSSEVALKEEEAVILSATSSKNSKSSLVKGALAADRQEVLGEVNNKLRDKT